MPNTPKANKKVTKPVIRNEIGAVLVNVEEPAHTIINRLGGVRAVSRALGMSAAGVTRWQKASARRGCGGVIPEARRQSLMALGRELGIRITRKQFEKSPQA